MALTAAIKYIPQLDPSTFQLQDTSNYAAPDSKTNISSRTVTILQSDGTGIPTYTNPIPFPYSGGDVLTISGLTQDYALKIILTLTPIFVNTGSIYSEEADVATSRFQEQGLYNIQVQKNNSAFISNQANSVYRTNSIDIIIEELNSQTALLYGDFEGSQDAIDRGLQIIQNTQL